MSSICLDKNGWLAQKHREVFNFTWTHAALRTFLLQLYIFLQIIAAVPKRGHKQAQSMTFPKGASQDLAV